MHGGEPVRAAIDGGEPAPTKLLPVRGQDPLRGTEENAPLGEGRIELIADNMPVERGDSATEGRGTGHRGGRLRGRFEKRLGERSPRGRSLLRRADPGARLEHPQVGPHPVLFSPAGEGEGGEPIDRSPAEHDGPVGERRTGQQPVEEVTVESRRSGDLGRGSGGCGRHAVFFVDRPGFTRQTPPSAVG